MAVEFENMGSDTYFPHSNGIKLGLSSTIATSNKPPVLAEVDLLIGGTPGTGADYQVEVQNENGDWIEAKDLVLSGDGAAATGQVSTTVEGFAVRLNAVNGSGPGSGSSTPRYFLGTRPLNLINSGEYTG